MCHAHFHAHAIRSTKENVRPIFWSYRPKSYIARTRSWDEFPNGGFGRSSSPAFGELSDYHIIGLYTFGSPERCKNMWGSEHRSLESVYQVFVNFIEGEISCLPWIDRGLAPESKIIKSNLIELNKNGFLTINSQPQANAIPSTDPVFGWGGSDGYCYQKAYLEFFCSPEKLRILMDKMVKYPSLTYHAVNLKNESFSNSDQLHSINAVTWGVFPASEIIQPTVVDADSFLVWKDEAFALLLKHWVCLYPEDSDSYQVLKNLYDTFYLVNIVENDYIEGDIFAIFKEIINEGNKAN
jgi:methylenetetrahydrofolate reductase (NADPH)